MRFFGKSRFLQKIKQEFPLMSDLKLKECKYHNNQFSEWLEFDYGFSYFVFYHAKRWGDEKITYRKSAFDIVTRTPILPYEVGKITLNAV